MKIASVLLAVGAVAALSAGARAEEPDTAPTGRLWSLQITPYVWASGISGEISPFQRAPTIGIDKSFSDILENLNVGGFVNLWARYDRFVFSADVMYVDTTDSHVSGPLPGYGPFPPGGNISASVDTSQFTSTLAAGYRIYQSPTFTFDALAGARIWQISNTVTGTYSFAPYTVSHTESFGWVDPIIAARGFFNLTDKISTLVQADVGGFGAGSDNTWQVLATVNYAFRPNMAVSAGYKYLHVDYDSDGYVFDTDLSGPVLGFTYRF